MSIIFVPSQLNQQAKETLGSIWRHTFYPYELYLPLSRADHNRLQTDMPNIITIPVESLASETERVDIALAKCDGEYVTIVPSGFPIREFWVEDSLYALINSAAGRETFELEGSTDKLQAIVARKDDLLYARKSFPNLSVYKSLKAAGVVVRRLRPEEIPFQFDQLLQEAKSEQKQGNWAQAAEIFEYIADHYQNQLWMKSLAANAFYKAGNCARATQLCSDINRQRPTVDTLLLGARIKRQEKDFYSAIELLERSEQILEGKELLWT